MTRSLASALAFMAAALSAPVAAQGPLSLLHTGEYRCALPGSAAGRAWVDQPARHFVIVRASRYRSANGPGTYLMTGDRVLFTGGALKGFTLKRISSGMLQEIGPDGKPGRLRCHRAGPIPDRR